MEGPNEEQPIKAKASEATGVLWLIGVLCLLFVLFLYLGSQPAATVKNTKLFPLFESKKYHQLEKKIDTENKVLLIGDDEDGLGIFIDQYVNERDGLATIKRRNYHFGKNLEYASDNIFAKAYAFYKNALASMLKQKQNEAVFWVIQSEGALNLGDIEDISEFMQTHPNDKFLVTAQVAPAKASRYFKVIQYEELPKKFVSQLLFKNHKIDKVNAQNLLKSFGGDLQTINDLIQQQDAETKFVESYQQQSEELNELLLANNKQVKKLLDALCKDGQFKAKKQLSFVPPNNKIIRYDNGAYEWKNIKALFAFSDRFNVACTTDADIDYVPEEEISQQSFLTKWFSFGRHQLIPTPIEETPKEQPKKSSAKKEKTSKTSKSQAPTKKPVKKVAKTPTKSQATKQSKNKKK